jgi:hypothetical protein
MERLPHVGREVDRDCAVGRRPWNNIISERSTSAVWWRTREECTQTSEVVEYDSQVRRVTEEHPSEV